MHEEHICPHCNKPYTYIGTEPMKCFCEKAIAEREMNQATGTQHSVGDKPDRSL